MSGDLAVAAQDVTPGTVPIGPGLEVFPGEQGGFQERGLGVSLERGLEQSDNLR